MNNSNLIPFAKAHGNGNDTILFIKENCPDIIYNKKFIKKICQRRTGIGSDCVIILSKDKKYDFKMDYYNSDGSWETFCANGARCAVKFLNEKKIISNLTTFISGDGIHKAIIDNNNISIKMKSPIFISKKINIENYSGYVVDSGAKHFCIKVNKINNIKNIEEIGKRIRNSNYFSPIGVNVNFFEIQNSKLLKIYTYEKGVEKSMLSCGSGSVASVFYSNQKFKTKNPIDCISKGGKLTINYDNNWNDVWIKGDTIILYESEINLNFF